MSELRHLEPSRSTFEAAAEPGRSREVLLEAIYYLRRARAHQAMAEQANTGVAAVHRELASAYLAAATTAERGGTIDFAGAHRAERGGASPQLIGSARSAAGNRPNTDWLASAGSMLDRRQDRHEHRALRVSR